MSHYFSAILVVVVLASACKSSEQTAVPVAQEEVVIEENAPAVDWKYGVITNQYASGGCAFLIETADKKLLHPLTLNERFQQNGLRVRFDARPTRAPITDGCYKGDLVILEHIEVVIN